MKMFREIFLFMNIVLVQKSKICLPLRECLQAYGLLYDYTLLVIADYTFCKKDTFFLLIKLTTVFLIKLLSYNIVHFLNTLYSKQRVFYCFRCVNEMSILSYDVDNTLKNTNHEVVQLLPADSILQYKSEHYRPMYRRVHNIKNIQVQACNIRL